MKWSMDDPKGVAHIHRVPFQRNREWEHWILLTADRHFDHPNSDHALQKKHLDQAVERGAAVMDFGDLFDAMQGRDDRRGSKSDLRKENQESDYFGSLTRDAVDFLSPYRKNLALLCPGNHETSVLKKHEYDLTRALTDRLSDQGSPVQLGGYRGWVRILFCCNEKSRLRRSLNLYYTHGYGGGGPVTRGVIQTNRRAVYLPDADIVVSGHVHESWLVEISRVKLSTHGVETPGTQLHISLPTYKEEFAGAGGGWHHETGKPPKPLGAWWLRMFWCRAQERILVEPIRAY